MHVNDVSERGYVEIWVDRSKARSKVDLRTSRSEVETKHWSGDLVFCYKSLEDGIGPERRNDSCAMPKVPRLLAP
jgi:hypothetical protein